MTGCNKYWLILFLALSACVSGKRNADGVYDYWYCIGYSGTPSLLLHSERQPIQGDISIVRSHSQLLTTARYYQFCSSLTSLETGKRFVSCTTETDTTSTLSVQPGDYSFELFALGFNSFTIDSVRLERGDALNLFVGLGGAGGFATLDLTSERKLMRWQLKARAKKWRRELYRQYKNPHVVQSEYIK